MQVSRVLFDAGPLMNRQKSGVGYYTKGILESLAHNYPDTTFTGYYFNFLGRKNVQFDEFPANVRFKPVRYFPGIILSPLSRVLGIQLPIELLVFRKYDLHFYPNFISLPSIRRTPNIIVIHDMGYIPYPEVIQPKNLRYLQKLLPRCVRRAAMIFTVSEFSKSEVVHYFSPAAPITVTPVPPVLSRYDDTSLGPRLRDLGIEHEAYFLFLGTIEPRKNLPCLVRAYAKLPTAIQQQYSLVLAGGTGWLNQDLLKEIEALRARGLRIIQTGYVSEQEKSALYANARLVALPAHYEGFGMPALEALVFGTPLLANDIPVFHEVAGTTARYFDGTEPTSLAAAITAELQHPLQRAQRQKHYAQLLDQYNWDSVAQKAMQAMEKIT